MKRAKHSLSHYKLLTCDMGKIVPIGCYEVLPGDSIQQASSALIRVTPLLAPVMHPVHVKIHHWFVPNRLVWGGTVTNNETSELDSWETFITGGRANPADPSELAEVEHPKLTVATGNESQVGSIFDYFGIPAGNGALQVGLNVNPLPLRAYNLIFNEYYRDQDLVDPVEVQQTSGATADSWSDFTLLSSAWMKDYFTTARPTPQKGPAVALPLGESAPIIPVASVMPTGVQPVIRHSGDGALGTGALIAEAVTGNLQDGGPTNSYLDPDGSLIADLTNASGATINDLRFALATQKDQEARNIYGSRYVEYLRYLGARPSDYRLARPVYLGGGKQTIQFSEVLQTGVTTSGSAAGVGNLKGHGIGAMRSNRFRKYFEEHGYIISLMIVNPVTMYPQGLFRMWNRRTKYDYFNKEFQHVGQQEVYKKECYAAAGADEVFGYQDRFDEYRRLESNIAGDFRTSNANFWHMARIFAAEPELNDEFVTANPTDRIYSTTAVDQLQVMVHHNIQARRIVHKNGNPAGLA